MAYDKQVVTTEKFDRLVNAAVDAVVELARREYSLNLANDSVAVETALENALSEILTIS